MNLVVIYGPPAVGKYTVGKVVAEKLGYRFVHNHLIVDCASALFSLGSPERAAFGWALWFMVLEEAMKRDISLVSTFVYEKGPDDQYVKRTIDAVQRRNGTILFVKLSCDERVLLTRVEHASREGTGKLSSAAELHSKLKTHDIISAIPFCVSFEIDTTKRTGIEAADLIVQHVRGLSH